MSCATCGTALDRAVQALCAVCVIPLCLACAREHLCTPQCAARGCFQGLCTKLVRDGDVAEDYGIP